MTLRSRLVILVLATALPLMVLAIGACVLLISHEQDKFADAVKQRNRALLAAIDAELKGHLMTLAAMTSLHSLAADDLRALHADFIAVQGTQPDWLTVILNAPTGKQLINAGQPYGTELGDAIDVESVRRSAETRQPVIGNVTAGPRRRFAIAVRMPVVRNGVTVYVLTAVLNPAAFQKMMADQKLPPDWVSGLVDRDARFVARVPARPIGSPASAAFRAVLASGNEGWYRGRTVEGLDTFTAYARSPLSGWSIGTAVPAELVLAGSNRIAWALTLAALFCIVMATIIALALGRRISRPISRLAASAPLLGHQGAMIDVDSDIPEVRDLASAMRKASEAIENEHRVAALERHVLAQSDRAKDEFIAMLSHEMRNPLAAITAASSLLKIAAPGTDALAAAHGVIDRQTRQLARLVEDLLDASRIAMGKLTLERQPLDLADVAFTVIDTWRQSGKLRDCQVMTSIGSAWVDGDRERLVQVVSNLLDNAVKFTVKPARISIAVGREGEWAKLVVADTGIGISRVDLARVFDLFTQGAQDMSRSRGGMGVGLALVKRLVEMHGGTIVAESGGTDQGSTFIVALPAIDAPVPSLATESLHSSKPSLRILLVEDNDDARLMLRALLGARGHAVTDAANGAAALDAARQQAFDVALVDIQLPDMSGYDLARVLRASEHWTGALVAITGYAQAQDQARAYDAGFDLHATKPLSEESLDAVLDSVLQQKEGLAQPTSRA